MKRLLCNSMIGVLLGSVMDMFCFFILKQKLSPQMMDGFLVGTPIVYGILGGLSALHLLHNKNTQGKNSPCWVHVIAILLAVGSGILVYLANWIKNIPLLIILVILAIIVCELLFRPGKLANISWPLAFLVEVIVISVFIGYMIIFAQSVILLGLIFIAIVIALVQHY